jgi:apolipoprotein N-acyltransferase
MTRIDRRPSLWLAVGAVLLVAAHLRFGLGLLAWVAPVPFLRYLRLTSGWKSRLALVGTLFAAWVGAVAKIVTTPIPLALAPAFAAPTALFATAPYIVHGWLAPRWNGAARFLVFPSVVAISEWAQSALTPFGTWGSVANTQLDDLALLQIAALTGAAGVSFLVSLAATVLEAILAEGLGKARAAAAWTAGLVAAAHLGGAARLALSAGDARPTELVAAVGTDSTMSGLPLPSPETIRAWEEGLLARTRRAAAAGARLAVWTEAATLVRPGDEPRFLERISEVAREHRMDVVAGYVVPLSTDPLRFENKYVYVRAGGEIHHSYLKNHPVPGEPAVPGDRPSPVVATEHGRIAGAICYDYDFPRLVLAHAERRVDLVALPSSDWRGIDPIHTQMAALRAIEGGHSILRSTRWGLSAGIDPEGRLRGSVSHFDDAGRLLLVRLPRTGVVTPYAVLGDWLPLALALGLAAAAFRRRWRGRAADVRAGATASPAAPGDARSR